MQYILSQEEYDDLKNAAQGRERSIKLAATKKMQALCTKIADTMPVKFWNNKEAKPWGCFLTVEKANPDGEWYCDECPVQEICPSTRKPYSK